MRLAAISAIFLVFSSAHAVEPGEQLADPALEARAREISRDIRCVVCQSENIDDSNAPLAHDLRVLVRERLSAGDSDEAVRDYLVHRYGDYVLLKPRVKGNTLALWLAPLIAALIGAAALFGVLRGAPKLPGQAPLSDAELDELRRLD